MQHTKYTDSFWRPKMDKVSTVTLDACIYQTEVKTARIRNPVLALQGKLPVVIASADGYNVRTTISAYTVVRQCHEQIINFKLRSFKASNVLKNSFILGPP